MLHTFFFHLSLTGRDEIHVNSDLDTFSYFKLLAFFFSIDKRLLI